MAANQQCNVTGQKLSSTGHYLFTIETAVTWNPSLICKGDRKEKLKNKQLTEVKHNSTQAEILAHHDTHIYTPLWLVLPDNRWILLKPDFWGA